MPEGHSVHRIARQFARNFVGKPVAASSPQGRFAEGAALLAELSFEALKDDKPDYIGGLEMGAVPLAGAIAQLSWLKGHPIAAFFVRKKPKEHGARLSVEGLTKTESLKGKRIV